jgi:isopenicillin N synthase-like dioxygenase
MAPPEAPLLAAGAEPNPLCPELPIFDLGALFGPAAAADPAAAALAAAIAACLARTSCLVVRDPRVAPGLDAAFLDLMEEYFSQPDAVKSEDARPECAYQVGSTPAGVERPRVLRDAALRAAAAARPAPHAPTLPTGADVKWRFFWRLGARPAATRFAELNAAAVVPAAFAERWAPALDAWGGAALAAARTVAEAAARGFGLPPDAFTRLMEGGPHLLAPTGADLAKHGAPGTVIAGYHYDLNFLSVHGRSRFPGLAIWLRDGRRVPVRVPPGCLLVQAGRQMEHLTGGAVAAGFHEVVSTEETAAAAAAAAAAGRPAWRVSSTVFTQIASDAVLAPLGRFATPAAAAAFPPTAAGAQVRAELEAICLRAVDADGEGG